MASQSNWKVFKQLRLAFWILEILECLFSIAILGVSGSSASGILNDLKFPTIPTKLSYTIAIAAITMLVLLVVVPLDLFRPAFWGSLNMLWAPWPRVIMSFLWVVLWAAALGSSVFSCSDLCSAASFSTTYLQYASLCCNCEDRSYTLCHEPSGLVDVHVEPREYRYEVTQALDTIMLALFLASTLILLAFNWFRAPVSLQDMPPEYEDGQANSVELIDHPHPNPMGKNTVADVTKW